MSSDVPLRAIISGLDIRYYLLDGREFLDRLAVTLDYVRGLLRVIIMADYTKQKKIYGPKSGGSGCPGAIDLKFLLNSFFVTEGHQKWAC